MFTENRITKSSLVFSPVYFLAYFIAIILSASSCRTIAVYDESSFVKTAELKAKTLVLMSHADEDYSTYRDKVDEVLILAEQIYAIQKARQLNYLTVKQWDIVMRKSGPANKSILPEFFEMWKRKGKMTPYFIEEAKEQVAGALDEILRLEENKLRR